MSKVATIVKAVYNYTHILVGAGAVAVSAIDPHQFPPAVASAVVLISQGLRVASDIFTKTDQYVPVVESTIQGIIKTETAPTAVADPVDPNAPHASL